MTQWSEDGTFWEAMEPALCAPGRLALAPGKYYLQVEAEDWRIVGALRQPAEATTSLGPAQ